MLRLALLLTLVAFLAGLFGFDLVAGYSFEAARYLFFGFLALAAALIVADSDRGRRRPADLV